jgi:predicted metal-binding transcription factor (methanogenesis marker protein 9)
LTHWLVVKTKRRHELQVAVDMAMEQIKAYVPVQIVFYRTKENRANGTRSRKDSPVLPGLVFIQCEFARPVAHIDGVLGYLRMSDYEYAIVQDRSFQRFCKQIEIINDELRKEAALQDALAIRKAKKETMKFKDALEILKTRMDMKEREAA